MTNSLQILAERYTAAWSSQNPASVAAFFSPNGSLAVNDAGPAVGRDAIAQVAQSFMRAFPDLHLTMDGLSVDGDHATYRWTLEGTYAGAGKRVRISGYEEWLIGGDGLISRSLGHFDAEEYARQLA
jgi:predicted ester cyclase